MSAKKVTKYDLIEAIYEKLGNKNKIDKHVIQDVVENFLLEIKDSLEKGATVELRTFGTFEPRLRKGRENARNPKTGELLSVAPHYVAVFRSGQELRNSIKKLKDSDIEK